jgi:peptidyl-tRNA hydrolase
VAEPRPFRKGWVEIDFRVLNAFAGCATLTSSTRGQPCIDLNGSTARHQPHNDPYSFLPQNPLCPDTVATAQVGPSTLQIHAVDPPLASAVPEDRLFTYVIIRSELGMPAGKLASQAVHAARMSLIRYLSDNPGRAEEFLSKGSCGSVVVLKGKRLSDLEKARFQALSAGIPCCLFSDSGHVLPPFFDGTPVVTALAIGPAEKESMRVIAKKFNCV